jgi:histone acetyltransferase
VCTTSTSLGYKARNHRRATLRCGHRCDKMGEPGAKRARTEAGSASSVAPPDTIAGEGEDEEILTPLQREILHMEQEQKGELTFPVVRNDGSDESVLSLIGLKCIFTEQLPKMPKEYISRLVLDRQHVSLACVFRGSIVGGITYRPVASQRMAEIVFCAVSAKHQVRGYGTRIMNQIKEECKRTKIEGMLTYADNHAVGYFRKQGFKTRVTMKRERWQGFLKDYEGATLMECLVDPTIDYLTTRQIAEKQRTAVVQRIAELGSDAGRAATEAQRAAQQHRELLRTGWAPPRLEVRFRGQPQTLETHLRELIDAVAAHEDAWPFQQPVSVAEAPDYYTIIKAPVDLSMVRSRLDGGNYYVTPDQMLADLLLMCENCRQYNGDSSNYSECATRLEGFVRARVGETAVKRLPPV